MKEILIMRHSKTESNSMSGRDIDRRLVESGRSDAERMGNNLLLKNVLIDKIIASPATRTKETACIIADVLGIPLPEIIYFEQLYLPEAEEIDHVIKNHFKSNWKQVLIITHNDGLTDYVNRKINNFKIDNMPTASIASFHLDIDKWSDNSMKIKGEFQYFDKP